MDWYCNVLFSSFCFCFFHYKQYISIENGKIVLRSYLYKIKELDINDCYYVVSRLLSSYGRVYLSEYWICIYSYKETKFFKYGFTNSKKHERIQLIYTEENLNYIKYYVNKKYDYFENYYAYLPVSVGVDFAFPIGSVFALGPYASLGSEASSFNVGLGALAMFRFKNECAIMVGEGLNIITDYGLGNSYRLGFKFKKRLYLLGEVNTSSFISSDPHIEQYNVSFLIHVGFKLN